MERLAKVIKSVFEDFDEGGLRKTMKLSEIPDWDSMNAVNLQLELESAYGIELAATAVRGDTTIGELAALLEKPVARP